MSGRRQAGRDRVAPGYFEKIRARAAGRWLQLEQDPELAGPWYQLFKQVQSPRHVLSELLQNADDAGATEAFADIVDDAFVFRHNGADFVEENFASLCRFGYSNKRALHTIGFRGIGFKSTFSLGDVVELTTPTLSVKFNRERFTEPVWVPRAEEPPRFTEVRVRIKDAHRGRELRKNLEEWCNSAVSLLFFRNLRTLKLLSTAVSWRHVGPGPVSGAEWTTSGDDDAQKMLVVRSEAEAFPPECLHEIRQERLLPDSEAMDFPPCRVEIVLGAPGQLFVVLPTGVETSLPFACNGPFIQDPARNKIKDPETSPTNRWLLERIGRVAAQAMVQWVGNGALPIEERARAYELLPARSEPKANLVGLCETIVHEAFGAAMGHDRIALTEDGELASEPLAVPDVLLEVWKPTDVSKLFGEDGASILARAVAPEEREKLVQWHLVRSVDKQELLGVLYRVSPPKPERWQGLLALWAFVAPELSSYLEHYRRRQIKIVPVQGSDELHASADVARLGDKKLLESENDWKFLAEHLLVLNPNWPRWLGKQRLAAEGDGDTALVQQIALALDLLETLGLESASDVSDLIELVAAAVFTRQGVLIADCIRVAHITAKLGAKAGQAFRYVTRDGRLRSTQDVLLDDRTGEIEDLLPEDWANAHLLHSDYAATRKSCTKAEWAAWVSSDRSGIRSFVPLTQRARHIYSKPQLHKELKEAGHVGSVSTHFRTSHFKILDWDFDPAVWEHWSELAAQDEKLWGRVLDHILRQPKSYWDECATATVVQVSTHHTERTLSDAPPLTPAWVKKLSGLKCLLDTRGMLHVPADLLRRTPTTEPLLDVEPFVRHDLDTEATRPLLKMLGVRDMPTGPDRMLANLKSLSASKSPPILEVEKWYRRLDQLIQSCSTEEASKITAAFKEQRLVLSDQGTWCSSEAVFLFPDEDGVPDASIIRSSVRDLTLWSRVGVADRPTLDLAIAWLKGLSSGAALSADDLKRVKGILTRHPARVWHECGHWINLAGEWVPVAALQLRLTMQALVPWGHLHLQVRQRTADFQRLPVEIIGSAPFSELRSLGGEIEERLAGRVVAGAPEAKPWLRRLGIDLQRLQLEDEKATAAARATAARLAATEWRTVAALEVVPYIDGIPAGTPRRVEAAWIGTTLYVEGRALPRLAPSVAEELARPFDSSAVKDAIKFCYEHPEDYVSAYLEQHLSLAAPSSEASPDSPVRPGIGNKPSLSPATSDVPAQSDTASGVATEHEVVSEAQGSLTGDVAQPESERLPVVAAEDAPEPPRTLPKPAQPSLVERFAAKQGFRKNGDGGFVHANGAVVCKSPDNAGLWERRAPDGTVVRYYWFKDHCLQLGPLEVKAELWGLLDKFPTLYSLVLLTADGDPVEYTGATLKNHQKDGGLALFPAAYRLVYEHETSEIQ